MPPSAAAVTAPTLTLGLTNFAVEAPPDGWGELIDKARLADRVGVDRIIVVDHVVMGEHIEAYDGNEFPTGPDGVWLEPMTLASVLAGVTRRVRLSTGILIAALRRPVVLAKAAATLDVLSGGRLDLGVGVGWQREEYEAAGLSFDERGDLLDETLAVCRALWGPSPARHHSERLDFERIWCVPKPVHPGGVPLWVSGRINRRTLERIVRFGDAWIPWGDYIHDVVPGIAAIRQAMAAAGRDMTGFGVRGALPAVPDERGGLDTAAMMRPVPGLVEAGVTDFNLGWRLPDASQRSADQLAELVVAFGSATGRG